MSPQVKCFIYPATHDQDVDQTTAQALEIFLSEYNPKLLAFWLPGAGLASLPTDLSTTLSFTKMKCPRHSDIKKVSEAFARGDLPNDITDSLQREFNYASARLQNCHNDLDAFDFMSTYGMPLTAKVLSQYLPAQNVSATPEFWSFDIYLNSLTANAAKTLAYNMLMSGNVRSAFEFCRNRITKKAAASESRGEFLARLITAAHSIHEQLMSFTPRCVCDLEPLRRYLEKYGVYSSFYHRTELVDKTSSQIWLEQIGDDPQFVNTKESNLLLFQILLRNVLRDSNSESYLSQLVDRLEDGELDLLIESFEKDPPQKHDEVGHRIRKIYERS